MVENIQKSPMQLATQTSDLQKRKIKQNNNSKLVLAIPDALEAEQAIIGILLIHNEKLEMIKDRLSTVDFMNEKYQAIYAAMNDLHSQSKPFDLVMMPDYLYQKQHFLNQSKDQILAYLGSITQSTYSAVNINYYAGAIKEASYRRTLLEYCDIPRESLLQANVHPETIAQQMIDNIIQLQSLYCLDDSNHLRVVEHADFLKMQLPPRAFILSPWLQTQSISMIYASRGIGKTFVSLGIAYAVASGGCFLGWQADKPRGVLFIDGEMPGSTLQERLSMLQHMNNMQPCAPLKIITPDLQSHGMPDLATGDGQQLINKQITDDIELIIIDNLSTLVRTGKENESESWQPIQTWALNLRARGKSILFIHHSGKNDKQRGTSKREDVLNTVIALRRPKDYSQEQGACFEVHFEKARNFYGEDTKPFLAQLTTNNEEKSCWVTSSLEESTFNKVVTLINEGLSQQEVSEELEINKSSVSRHAAKAKAMGLLK